MAKAKKTAQGTWRIQIEVQGVRDSNTLPTKREADAWAAQRATEIRSGGSRGANSKTLKDALRRYAEEVSPTKRGCGKELVRLVAFEQRQGLPVTRKIGEVATADLALWRDARLTVNSRGSVLRDMTLLGHVFEVARREWQWIEKNPMRDVRRPQEPDHRRVLIAGWQQRRMLRALGYKRGPVRTVSQAVALAFLLALSSGMRAGEICGINWGDVRADHVRLTMTKNGTAREVPLSSVGRKIVERLRGWDDVSVFGLKSQTLDALFRKAKSRAGLGGFTFHDSRRNAATRISRLVDPLALCRIFGWSSTTMALTYYAPNVSAMSALLDGGRAKLTPTRASGPAPGPHTPAPRRA